MAKDGEDGADTNPQTKVGRTVEGIKQHRILPPLLGTPKLNRFGLFFRAQQTQVCPVAQTTNDDFVGHKIHGLLLFTVDVVAPDVQDRIQMNPANFGSDHLPSQGDGREKPTELSRGVGVPPGFLKDEALNGREVVSGVFGGVFHAADPTDPAGYRMEPCPKP